MYPKSIDQITIQVNSSLEKRVTKEYRLNSALLKVLWENTVDPKRKDESVHHKWFFSEVCRPNFKSINQRGIHKNDSLIKNVDPKSIDQRVHCK